MISPETCGYQATARGLNEGGGVTLFKRRLAKNEFLFEDSHPVIIPGIYGLNRNDY